VILPTDLGYLALALHVESLQTPFIGIRQRVQSMSRRPRRRTDYRSALHCAQCSSIYHPIHNLTLKLILILSPSLNLYPTVNLTVSNRNLSNECHSLLTSRLCKCDQYCVYLGYRSALHPAILNVSENFRKHSKLFPKLKP